MAKFTCRDCTRFLLLAKECQKKIPERSNGWLVVSVSSNSAFTARTTKSCKRTAKSCKKKKNLSILKTLSTVIKSAVVYKSEKLVSLPIVQALTVARNHLIYKVNNNKKQRELSRSHVSKLKICIK